MSELSLPVLIGAAVIDSINPCAFGVLIFLLAYLSKAMKGHKGRILLHGLIYISAVFLTYLIAGLILLPVIDSLRGISVALYYVIAGLIGLAGLLEIKDFFWYGRGFSLAIIPSEAKRLERYITSISDRPLTAFSLGVFVALVELPCTGAVYLAVLSLIALSGASGSSLAFLLLYNLIFILPLVIILLLYHQGMTDTRFEAWRNRYKKWMRLLIGVLLLAMASWMIWLI